MNKDKWEAFKNQATEFKQKAAAKATELGERAIEKKNELQLKAADKLRRQKPDEPAQVILLPSLFGMPLQEAVETSLPSALPFIVPSIVWTCCDYIDKNGLQEVGIYRLSGSLSCINDIRTSFTVSYEYEIQEKDVHAVAGVLKAYLRELPENILTKKLSPLFQNLFSNTELEIDLSSQVLINQVKELLDRLPNENYNLLALLSRHFERIVDNSPVIFTLTLGISSHLLSIFITNWNYLFPVPRESVKSGTLEDSLEKINFEKELENTISEPVLVAPKLAERPMITDINQTRISPRVESRNHKINDVKSSPEKPRPERSTSKLSNHSMNSVAKTNGEEILETVSDQKSKVPPQKPERVSSKNVNRKID